MSGSFDYEPYSTQLALDATAMGVFLYDDTEDAGNRYTVLPNICCEQIQYKEGAAPPSARFIYILDELAAASWMARSVRPDLAADCRYESLRRRSG